MWADIRRAVEGGPGSGGHTWRASFWHRWGWKAKWAQVQAAGQEGRGPVERQRPCTAGRGVGSENSRTTDPFSAHQDLSLLYGASGSPMKMDCKR